MAIRKIVARSIGVDVIVAEDIAANAITAAEISSGAVTADKLASDSVTTAKITDANVTTAKLATTLTVTHALGSASTPSLTFTGDTNTGIFSPAADTIAFAEGGAEIARFDSSGNLGVGITAPLAKLDIQGNTVAYSSMAKIYLTDVNANTGSRNWSIGNGGSNYGNLTISVSAAKDGNAGDNTSVPCLVSNSSGYTTTPQQPHARASRNSGAITGNNVIVFNFADQNTAGMYNTSNGRFTAPVAGRYLFCHGMFTNASTTAWVAWRVNGTNIATTYTEAVPYGSAAGSIVLTMNANDYADLYVNGSSYAVYGGDRFQCWATFTLLG